MSENNESVKACNQKEPVFWEELNSKLKQALEQKSVLLESRMGLSARTPPWEDEYALRRDALVTPLLFQSLT